MLSLPELIKIKELRKKLHSIPEKSECEIQTSKLIEQELKALNPHKIVKFDNNNGIAACFINNENQDTIVLRCELDGVEIQENNNISYISKHNGFSHACGHDGHMAIVIGVGKIFSRLKLNKNLILLFQPAEENGNGALSVLKSKNFKFSQNSIFIGFHNVPGFNKGTILLKNDLFCPGSCGVKISLQGKTTHASTPDKGISPVFYIQRFLSQVYSYKKEHQMITVPYINAGTPGFGILSANGEINITLRSFSKNGVDELIEFINQLAKKIFKDKIACNIELSDTFPEVINPNKYNLIIEKSLKEINSEYIYLEKPMPWSEDFGVYQKNCQGIFMGIGSGISTPGLHSNNYDFPDDIIEPGIKILQSIIKNFQ